MDCHQRDSFALGARPRGLRGVGKLLVRMVITARETTVAIPSVETVTSLQQDSIALQIHLDTSLSVCEQYNGVRHKDNSLAGRILTDCMCTVWVALNCVDPKSLQRAL